MLKWILICFSVFVCRSLWFMLIPAISPTFFFALLAVLPLCVHQITSHSPLASLSPIFSLSHLPLISRCGASLQHLPHPQRHPALHGRPVYSCQWVLQVTPQHHPQRRDLLCVCRSVKHPQNETKAWEFVKPSALILNWLQTMIRTHSQAGQFRIS